MSSSVTTANGVVVVTQVYPQQSVTAVPAPCTMARVSSVLGKFLKGQPKALGTVQIMIGFSVILFGIMMTTYIDTVSVVSGIVYWGALIYISSGALTVAADNKLNACVVKSALGMNIASTITAGFAIILHSVDIAFYFGYSYGCRDYMSSSYHDCTLLLNMYKDRKHGIIGVLLVFSILEFIVSIWVSAFACKAVCRSDPEQMIFVENTITQFNPEKNLPISTPHAYEAILPTTVAQSFVDSIKTNNETESPPKYTA